MEQPLEIVPARPVRQLPRLVDSIGRGVAVQKSTHIVDHAGIVLRIAAGIHERLFGGIEVSGVNQGHSELIVQRRIFGKLRPPFQLQQIIHRLPGTHRHRNVAEQNQGIAVSRTQIGGFAQRHQRFMGVITVGSVKSPEGVLCNKIIRMFFRRADSSLKGSFKLALFFQQDSLQQQGIRCAGLLATNGTVQTGVYARMAERFGLTLMRFRDLPAART